MSILTTLLKSKKALASIGVLIISSVFIIVFYPEISGVLDDLFNPGNDRNPNVPNKIVAPLSRAKISMAGGFQHADVYFSYRYVSNSNGERSYDSFKFIGSIENFTQYPTYVDVGAIYSFAWEPSIKNCTFPSGSSQKYPYENHSLTSGDVNGDNKE